jgi:hypothetical protein
MPSLTRGIGRWLIPAALVLVASGLILLAAQALRREAAGSGNPLRDGYALARISGKVQEVETLISAAAYPPLAVQKGIAVRWKIRAEAESLNACNERLVCPDLGLAVRLVPGVTIVEFTPERAGAFYYSCWMGMIGSSILVVEDLSKALPLPAVPPLPTAARGFVPTGEIAVALPERDGQAVSLRVESDGFHPAIVVLRRGSPATIAMVPGAALPPEDSLIEFPGHDQRIDLASGKGEARFEEVVADFTFRSASALGYVKVVDDPAAVDLEAVRSEVASYRPAGEALAPCCGY